MNTKKLRLFTLSILLCALFCIVSLPVLAQQARFRVTLNGFRVNQQTNEGLEVDGRGDEVRFTSHVGTVDAAGRLNPIIWGSIFTSTIPGLVNGSENPSAEPWRRTLPINQSAMPPTILFEDDIIQSTRAALIIPTIWESDGRREESPLESYANQIDRDLNNLTSVVASMIRTPTLLELDKYLRSGSDMRINNTVTHTGGFPQDRPIGMQTRGPNQFGFTPQVLVLTFQSASFISRTNFGSGIGVVPVRYVDNSFLQGDYTLYLQVEQLGEAPPCPAPLASTFSGVAEMVITDPADPIHPIRVRKPVSFPVEFTDCRTNVRITDFPPIISDPFNVTIGSSIRENITTVTRTSSGGWSFRPDIGRSEIIPISLNFRHSLQQEFGILARPSDLRLELSTQGEGSKKDRGNGSIVMVGSSPFSGGYLNGRTGHLTITGSFSPRPSNP